MSTFITGLVTGSLMTNEDAKFCAYCGANLPSGSSFCPECGSSVGGGDNPYRRVTSVNASNPLETVATFTLIYGIIAAILGLISILVGFAFDQTFVDEMIAQFPELEAELSTLDVDLLRDESIIAGVLSVASGALAIVAYGNMKKLVKWQMTFILMILSSILSIGFIFVISVIVGFVMCYYVYKNKDAVSS